jgi:hypothetical protein
MAPKYLMNCVVDANEYNFRHAESLSIGSKQGKSKAEGINNGLRGMGISSKLNYMSQGNPLFRHCSTRHRRRSISIVIIIQSLKDQIAKGSCYNKGAEHSTVPIFDLPLKV